MREAEAGSSASHGTVFLSAGESSGDLHGAELARELRRRRPGLRLVGLGGSRMRAAGVELLDDLDTLAVMGFAEVVRKLPALLTLRWRVRRFLAGEGVDLLVPIDYPGFNLSIACHAHRKGIPVLYYIAPQVWAWRASRARRLAECVDRVCAVLPFEKEFLERYGADVRFVGHPLLDGGRRPGGEGGASPSGAASGGTAGAPGDAPVLGLLPGSRRQELDRMLAPFLEAARRLRQREPGLRTRIARAPDLARELFPPEEEGLEVLPPEEVVASADVAVTKSGTVTLQLALAGVPMVVGYRTSPLTYWIARRLVEVEHVALVNLVADRRLVPELLQDEMTPGGLAREAHRLLREPGERRRVLEGLRRVRDRLGEPGCAARVAEEALSFLPEDAGAGRGRASGRG